MYPDTAPLDPSPASAPLRALPPDAPPVAVGALGGSGTRAVAAVLRAMGYRIGEDLNRADDNLWFTLLFKQRGILDLDRSELDRRIALFVAAMSGRGGVCDEANRLEPLLADRDCHSREWLRERVESLGRTLHRQERRSGPWAWKEPNTHVVIEHLAERIPRLRYVHVVRDGLDMAFSRNRNQLALWGPTLFGIDAEPTPAAQLRYWCAVHERIARLRDRHPMPVLFLPYEALCREPVTWLERLARHVGANPGREAIARLARLIEPSAEIGRHARHDLSSLEPDDVAFARERPFLEPCRKRAAQP